MRMRALGVHPARRGSRERSAHGWDSLTQTEQAVSRLALLSKGCGLDGVVCSALETMHLRSLCGEDFCLVTPGIRPAHADADDQQRISTPASAIAAGASYLVIGRPITRAPDPASALRKINQEIRGK